MEHIIIRRDHKENEEEPKDDETVGLSALIGVDLRHYYKKETNGQASKRDLIELCMYVVTGKGGGHQTLNIDRKG